MRIGLIIAIEREMISFLQSGEKFEEIDISERKVYKAQMNGNEVYAVKSGYGEIDAAAATQLLISCFSCEMILNFGVTGALERSLRVDDLFVVRKVRNYDFDVSPIDPVKPNQYEEFEDEFIPLDDGLIAACKKLDPTLRETVVASGGRFIEKREDKVFLNSLGCNICDMEIAAIARICYLSKVPCLSVKCISDTFDGDGGDFNTNVTRSAQRAFAMIQKFIASCNA